tara:strand:+ start:2645 stop:3391 length:747 start_codon:yes stop_codon:yes gene_type:complete
MSSILVVGDSCKDVHVYGKSTRLCPDAPVPVFVPLYEKQNLGMAGNVYQNVVSLGIPAILKCNNIVIEKKRYVEEKTNHMFLRVDSGEEKIKRVEGLTKDFLQQFELIIISDYNKGFLLEEDIEFICKNHDLVFIDTKKVLGGYCQNCSYIKINQVEYNNSIDYIQNNSWAYNKIIQTLGSSGCQLGVQTFPVERVEIKDLCGAGDTFLASLCVKYLKTKDIQKSIMYANECATKVVQMKGVNTINEF